MSPARFRCANSLGFGQCRGSGTTQGKKQTDKQKLVEVGFEPTPPKRLELESSALDHSAIQPEWQSQTKVGH